MNGKYYESELEQSFIDVFKECGWTYSHGDQVDRNAEDIIIKNDLFVCMAGAVRVQKGHFYRKKILLIIINHLFLTTVARIPSPIGEGMNCTFEHVCSNS